MNDGLYMVTAASFEAEMAWMMISSISRASSDDAVD
jgi:hypothetical protein